MGEHKDTVSCIEGNLDYYDFVNNFDIEYKVTPPSERLDDIIHYHEGFEIILYVQANISAYIGDGFYNLRSNDVLIIPPGNIHKLVYHPGELYCRYVFYFPLEEIKKAFLPDIRKKALKLFLDHPYRKISLDIKDFTRISHLFQNMCYHKKQNSKCGLTDNYSSIILLEIYLLYHKRAKEPLNPKQPSTIEQILKYLNDHYSEPITLEDFEKKFYLSRYHICRLFHKSIGISLIEYLQFKRIMESQRLLVSSDKSIMEISLECGFNNIQHFYRVFKKITHLTPKQFIKGHIEGGNTPQTVSLKH